DLEVCLAQWCIKLAKIYKDSDDGHLTYIAPSGTTIPLTPVMVLDWAHALEEGQALLNMPPNIPSFDVANKALFLHKAHKAQAQKAASQSPPLDINSLMLVIPPQTLANLSSAGTHSPTTTTITTVPAPMTPVCCVPERSTSPLVPSPSQLMWFLKYAEMELHVENATMFEQRLAGQHISPDILPKIEDKILAVKIGIPAGDIICLKKGSIKWWNGPNAKPKCSNTHQSQLRSRSATHPPQKRVVWQQLLLHWTSNDCRGWQ
ncbi:hypothetical protein PAXRUDRAFT_150098, partial [Paxillus rubicundulus Ve08.2h10]